MSLSERLRAVRDERGLSNREIAKAAGISPPTVDRMMNGQGRSTLDNVDGVARVLGIPLAEARQLAGLPPRIGEEYKGPRESRLLTARQRAALDEMIRSIVVWQSSGDGVGIPDHGQEDHTAAWFSAVEDPGVLGTQDGEQRRKRRG